jgi:hypothetical protein
VDSRWKNGDYEGAEKAAQKARKWFWWSVAVGLVINTIYVIAELS